MKRQAMLCIFSMFWLWTVAYAAPTLPGDELAPEVRPANAQYRTVPMNPAEVASDQARHVQYLTSSQREEYRVIIKNGIVYKNNGVEYPDTHNDTPGHIDHVNYVMDPNGNFYLFDEYATPTIRHSSLFDGKPVAGAGEIIIRNGEVTYVDSDSGHYASGGLMPDVLSQLKENGVDTSSLEN